MYFLLLDYMRKNLYNASKRLDSLAQAEIRPMMEAMNRN
jgi:hypothetical protein